MTDLDLDRVRWTPEKERWTVARVTDLALRSLPAFERTPQMRLRAARAARRIVTSEIALDLWTFLAGDEPAENLGDLLDRLDEQGWGSVPLTADFDREGNIEGVTPAFDRFTDALRRMDTVLGALCETSSDAWSEAFSSLSEIEREGIADQLLVEAAVAVVRTAIRDEHSSDQASLTDPAERPPRPDFHRMTAPTHGPPRRRCECQEPAVGRRVRVIAAA